MTAPAPANPGAASAALAGAAGAAPGARAASPCTNVCRMDEASGLCRGCARTIDEIARWSRMSDDERRAVWAELPARRQRLPASPVEQPPR